MWEASCCLVLFHCEAMRCFTISWPLHLKFILGDYHGLPISIISWDISYQQPDLNGFVWKCWKTPPWKTPVDGWFPIETTVIWSSRMVIQHRIRLWPVTTRSDFWDCTPWLLGGVPSVTICSCDSKSYIALSMKRTPIRVLNNQGMAQGISSLNDWSPLATKPGAQQRQLRMRQKAVGVLEATVAAAWFWHVLRASKKMNRPQMLHFFRGITKKWNMWRWMEMNGDEWRWMEMNGDEWRWVEMISGWWYTYPSEKYDFVSWDDDIPK